MAFKKLQESDKRLIWDAMNAILNGPFIDDPEFETRMGIQRIELGEILSAWPVVNDAEGTVACIAINNCMNEVCHGVYVSPTEWSKWFTNNRAEIVETYARWAQLKGYSSPGLR